MDEIQTVCRKEADSMSKNLNDLLVAIAQRQANCGPINLSIGAVSKSGQVQHDCIVIYDCPGCIVDLVNQTETVRCSMQSGGLYITTAI